MIFPHGGRCRLGHSARSCPPTFLPVGKSVAKRLSDTEKWMDGWFRRLPTNSKMLWLYILDRCDIAGVWECDLDLFGLLSGVTVTTEEMHEHLGERLHFFDNERKVWVRKFIDFQNGHLREESESKIIQLIIRTLKSYNLWIPYTVGINTHHDRAIVKERVKEEEKEQEKERAKPKFSDTSPETQAVFDAYPSTRKINGKTTPVHKTLNDYNLIAGVLNNKPDYPLLEVVILYAASTEAPKDLRTFLAALPDPKTLRKPVRQSSPMVDFV